MDGQTCENCIFWKLLHFYEDKEIEETTEGYCRRYPPVINQTVIEIGAEGDGIDACEEAARKSSWDQPVTFPDQWCGEWKAKE